MMLHTKLLLSLVIFGLCSLSEANSKSCVQKHCPKNGNGVLLLPVVDDCEKYIACHNGRSKIRSCSDDYRFDVDNQACVPKRQIKCNECDNDSNEDSNESSESSEAKDAIVTKPETKPKPDPKPKPESSKPKPDLPESKPDLPESNPDLPESKPDLPESKPDLPESKPDSPEPKPDPLPELELDKEVSPQNNISDKCITNSVTPFTCPSDLPEDRLFPHPDDCHLFYYCVFSTSEPICRECPANLHFNPEKSVCDHSEVAGCSLKTKRSATSKAKIEPCNEHNGDKADLRSDPEDCNKYYVCDWGRLIHMSCPKGMHFSNLFKVCDLPENARCELGNSTGEGSGVALERIELVPRNNISQKCIDNSVTDVKCPKDLPEDRLLPHPDDCELFYYCITSELPPICRDCPAGLHFNPEKKVCDKPEDAGCKVESRADLVCKSQNGEYTEFKPNPEDCGKYYVCDWGNLISMSCPEGLHFNTALNVCDYPERANCESSIPA